MNAASVVNWAPVRRMKWLQKTLPGRVITAYAKSHAGTYAASLALNILIAMFPTMLGIITLLQTFIHSEAGKQRFFGALAAVFPPEQHKTVINALGSVHQGSGLLAGLILIGLFWAGSNVFAAMEMAFTELLGGKRRDALRERLMGLLMAVLFLAAVFIAVVGNSAAATSVVGGLLDAIAGAVGLVVLLTLIYRWVPHRTYTVPQIVPGALLVAVLIEVFSLLFRLYALLLGGFGIYGQEFALFFFIVIWVVFVSHFLLLGAVFNRVRLGAPRKRGAAANSGSSGRTIQHPVRAEQRQQRGRRSRR